MHIVSIPHTATRFTADLFRLEMDHTNYTHLEMTHNAGPAFKAGREHRGRIVVPLRNPARALDTWSKNNRHTINSAHGIGRAMFIGAWPWLLAFCEEFKPYLLPVDHPDRLDYLERIIKDLKPSINQGRLESWAPVGHNANAPQPVRGLDLRVAYKSLELLGVHYDYEPPAPRSGSVGPDSGSRASFGVW